MTVLLVVLLLIAFQNCAPGFNVIGSSNSAATSTASNVSLSLVNPANAKLIAGPVNIDFQITANSQNVDPNALQVLHEKKVHVIIFDAARDVFAHVHPDWLGSYWTVQAALPKNGNYSFWVEGQLNNEEEEFKLMKPITVVSGSAANTVPSALAQNLSWSDGESKVDLSDEVLSVGQEVMFELNFSSLTSEAVSLSNYLGEKVHTVITPLGSDGLIHAHPMEMSSTQLMLHTTFPEPGDYRIWSEFIDRGKYKVAVFAVKVPVPPTNNTSLPDQGLPNGPVSFKNNVLPILNAKCLSCHTASVYTPDPNANCRGWVSFENRPLGSTNPSSQTATGCADLTLFQRLMSAPWQCSSADRLVKAGDPNSSYLYRKIVAQGLCEKVPGQLSDPMPPSGSPQLTNNEKEIFRLWISEGAKDN